MHLHPTISSWQREEDGSYQSEKNGWKLHVAWVSGPRTADEHGFSWKAEKDGSEKKSEGTFEEIELAMAHAERAVAEPPAAAP